MQHQSAWISELTVVCSALLSWPIRLHVRKYKQLTQEQRYQIYSYSKVGYSQTQIALEIGVHKSSISRELKRNTGQRGYRAKQAQELTMHRRIHASKFQKLTEEILEHIELKLKQEWSPEQISGSMETYHLPRISHETIYQHILIDKRHGGTLYKHLRQFNKKRKKRYGSNDKRGQIKERISIDERPRAVDDKARLGDWEIDTVIGKNHKGALITIVERVSKFTLIKKVANKTAEAVTAGIISLLETIKHKVLTITADNGKEFAYHKQVSKALNSGFYFAHPYHSWERGLNENTNGLIRQYFPKKTSFDNISDENVETVMNRLNSRPRKSLGFKTPNNIFLENQTVALNA